MTGLDPDALDLERRLRGHYASLSTPVPDHAVAEARRRTRLRKAVPRHLLVAATLGVLVVAVGAIAVGTQGPELSPSVPFQSASPTSLATPASSAGASTTTPGPTLYSAGDTLRVTAAFAMNGELTAQVGQSVYVVGVELKDGVAAYRLQHWGDLESGLKPDTVIGTVPVEVVDEQTQSYDPACPDVIEQVEDVARLQPFERLACFGSRPLAFGPVRREAYAVMTGNPPWLGGPNGVDFFTALPFSTATGLEVPAGAWLTVSGHFNDAACGDDLRCRERLVVTAFEPTAPPSSELGGTWRSMSPAPISGRSRASGLWTGTEFIVWGGTGGPDGAAYDPDTDTWRTLARSPMSHREHHTAVWTGKEMLIWGGDEGAEASLASGAAYDPAADTWRAIADAPFSGELAVWAGSKMIAFDDLSRTAAAYDPTRDRWTLLPAPPVGDDYPRSAAWTGTEVLLFLGQDGVDTGADGLIYDPETAAWRTMAPSILWALGATPMLWADDEALGVSWFGESATGRRSSVAYVPSSDTWRPLGSCWPGSHPVWTGSVVLGEQAAFDPDTDTCLTLPTPPERPSAATTGREESAYVWTGTEYLIWSGGNGSDMAVNDADGIIFRPDR